MQFERIGCDYLGIVARYDTLVAMSSKETSEDWAGKDMIGPPRLSFPPVKKW